MIKKFNQYILENKESDYLLYYAFDWDDNILFMPTVIHMEKKVGDNWESVDVSTAEFAIVRTDKDNYRLTTDAFSEFRDDGPRGVTAFLTDVKSAVSQNKFGPSWEDFIECLCNGSLFAIITARGHEPAGMRLGIEWIVDNLLTEDQLYMMYNNLIKFAYLFNEEGYDRILKGTPSENKLVKSYLDSCDLVGVSSPSRGGSPSNPEKAKEIALLEFKSKVNSFAEQLGMDAKIGFSDDDLKNVKHIEDLVSGLHHEMFPKIKEIIVKGTTDPKNITTMRRTMGPDIIEESSNEAPGLQSSVLKFTQFGNMAGQLNPQGPDQRQDDFANQFKRQTRYLTKTSKDILGNKNRKKKD